MKRFLILSLLLISGCGSPVPTEPASFFDPALAAANLSLESTSEQIRGAMLESARQWTTLQMDGTVTWFAGGVPVQAYHELVTLDLLNSRYRVEWSGVLNSLDHFLKFSDGAKIHQVNFNSGQVDTLPYPESAKVGQYIPPYAGAETYPNPFSAQIGTPLAQLAFPSDYAQNTGVFTPISFETVAGREALAVEWKFSEGSAVMWKMWLDTQTAMILRLQDFSNDGSGAIEADRAVSSILFNPALDASAFTLPADLPQVAAPTGTGSQPVVTESGPVSEEEAGELYFFLQPRQAGGNIQLARVSGLCVFDPAKCPPMQIVIVPFAFNFTINALSWSPDGQFAAFAYSDHPNGTPTKLWRFDPIAGTWASLAEFPYIDPPFWSPDGQWIAFRTQDGAGGEEVYVIHRDGSGLKSISSGLPAEGRPYVMDGWYTENIIMRPAIPGGSGSVYLVRASDGAARPMFSTQLTKAQFIASPDASLLAYDDYSSANQNHVLKVMEPDGANPVTLANFTAGSLYPIVWSPDSQHIAFNYFGSFTNGEPSAEVFVVGRSGGELSSVYKGATVGRLVFSPNGRYLLVEETTSTTGGHLFLIDLATLEKKMLQAPGLSTDFDWYAPSWRP
jgi:Tol biopolymer transport system component